MNSIESYLANEQLNYPVYFTERRFYRRFSWCRRWATTVKQLNTKCLESVPGITSLPYCNNSSYGGQSGGY